MIAPYYEDASTTLYNGDSRKVLPELPDESVNCCVTSPPYFGLRDYGVDGQIGLEKTPDDYVAEMVNVFGEVRRVLKDDGTVWLNIGDSYNGSGKGGNPPDSPHQFQKSNVGSLSGAKARNGYAGLKQKDLIGIPWRVAFALQADGWYLRNDIIWHKPSTMPESVTDRCTRAHEHIFLLAKSQKYYFDADAIAEPVAESSLSRLAQDVENQQGSFRANGGEKINGPMKAVGRGGGACFGKQNFSGEGTGAQSRTYERPAYEKRNKRDVWTVAPACFSEAHFATFPPKLIEPCIMAGCPIGGTVLDPFFGAGTTGLVCMSHAVRCIGIELNKDYCAMAVRRLAQGVLFTEPAAHQSHAVQPARTAHTCAPVGGLNVTQKHGGFAPDDNGRL